MTSLRCAGVCKIILPGLLFSFSQSFLQMHKAMGTGKRQVASEGTQASLSNWFAFCILSHSQVQKGGDHFKGFLSETSSKKQARFSDLWDACASVISDISVQGRSLARRLSESHSQSASIRRMNLPEAFLRPCMESSQPVGQFFQRKNHVHMCCHHVNQLKGCIKLARWNVPDRKWTAACTVAAPL